MGMLTTFHHELMGPHIGKMVSSIVKRLKDPDSVVRNACIETVGVLASKFSTSANEPEGSFVVLVRPLFEALGEQNKHVQFGSALCLSRVIDHTRDPPLPILQRMLTRTTKMLKNPHFMTKPAMIELNRSIIQAGGASTPSMLITAMTSIQDALKNSDWRTRKAASEALAEIASSNASYPVSLKSSCIRSLELCRFDKVAVSTNRTATSQVPNYPNLPSQLLCQVLNATLHADKETDEIYAQMSLRPVNSEKDVLPIPDFGMKPSRHPSEFFCKTLTPSDTSTHGGFSVPRRAAEKLFPQLDFSMQPPTQELIVRDLHDNTWTFRHIYRGQPKRHLLTTGWSMFVGAKRLKAGDAVLFIRDEKSQLLLGVRRANRQQTSLPSSVLSADSMHIGVLAAAAHAAANRSPFTIFYNPRKMILRRLEC